MMWSRLLVLFNKSCFNLRIYPIEEFAFLWHRWCRNIWVNVNVLRFRLRRTHCVGSVEVCATWKKLFILLTWLTHNFTEPFCVIQFQSYFLATRNLIVPLLIMFQVHTPRCITCEATSKKVEKLAKHFKGLDDLTFARIDAYANEHPKLQVRHISYLLLSSFW